MRQHAELRLGERVWTATLERVGDNGHELTIACDGEALLPLGWTEDEEGNLTGMWRNLVAVPLPPWLWPEVHAKGAAVAWRVLSTRFAVVIVDAELAVRFVAVQQALGEWHLEANGPLQAPLFEES